MLKRIIPFETTGIFTINYILFIPTGILFVIEVLEETKLMSKIKESGNLSIDSNSNPLHQFY